MNHDHIHATPEKYPKLKLGSKEEFIDVFTSLEYNADVNKIKEIFCRMAKCVQL